MYFRFIHLLMVVTVLVCPALGGRCCGVAETTEWIQDDDACGHGCCHEQAESDAPLPLSCPDPCHDCFCAGALPPGPTVADGMNEFSVSFDVVVSTAVGNQTSLSQRFSRIDIDSSPPAGRERLTIFCTLLI